MQNPKGSGNGSPASCQGEEAVILNVYSKDKGCEDGHRRSMYRGSRNACSIMSTLERHCHKYCGYGGNL